MKKTLNVKIYFVGAGAGDPELLTLKGKRLLEQADLVVFAGSLVNKDVLDFAGGQARLLDSAPLDLAEIVAEMAAAAKKGEMVVRLHSGDPAMYGAIAEQMELLDREEIAYEVVPGVSSAFAAAAALKMEYTLPEVSQTLILTRRSGRTPVPEKESLRDLARHRASMSIFLSAGMIDEVVSDLVEGGYPETTPAAIVYRASWPDEKVLTGTLQTIGAAAKRADIHRQALIIVGEAVGRKIKAQSKLYAPDFSHGYRASREQDDDTVAIVAVTRRGRHTGTRLLHALDEARLFLPEKFSEEVQDERVLFYESLHDNIEEIFGTYRRIVLIMATGIAVRMIAPLLESKWKDPAVVSMDDSARNIISLVSGHWGGANDLTEKLSHIIGGNPVVTTESDVMGFPAVDVLVKTLTGGKVPADPGVLKGVQAAILEDEDVGFFPRDLSAAPLMKGHKNLHFFDSVEALVCSQCTAGLIVAHHAPERVHVHERFLVVQPRDLVVGIGCHAGIRAEEIERGIQMVFQDMHLSVDCISRLCSIDRKQEEQGLIDYARFRNVPISFFPAEIINRVSVPSPASEHAMEAVGARGVAEPCAILGAEGGKLLMNKMKLDNMTIAIATISLKNLLEDEVTDND